MGATDPQPVFSGLIHTEWRDFRDDELVPAEPVLGRIVVVVLFFLRLKADGQ